MLKRKKNEVDLPEDISKKENFSTHEIELPSMVLIGFYEGVTKKSLFDISKGYANRYFDNPYMANYKCKKHNNGYIYEIHDGSKNCSYIEPVLNSLMANGVCYLLTRHKTIKVMEVHGKIQSYVMPVDNVEIIGDKVQPVKAKTEKLYTESGGFLVFGFVLALLGVLSIFASSILKYSILDENRTISYSKQLVQSPLDYFNKLPEPTEVNYVSKIIFSNGAWKNVLGTNPMPTLETIVVSEKDILDIEKTEVDSLENSLLKENIFSLTKELEKFKSLKPKKDESNINLLNPNIEKNIPKLNIKENNIDKVKKDIHKKNESLNLKNIPSNVMVEKS